MAVGNWGMAPSEFWELSPTEFWLIYEAKIPPKRIGGMSEEQTDTLTEMLEEAEQAWQAQQLVALK